MARPDPALRGALAALGALTALRLVVAATTGLVEDEAYYWTWAKHLAFGYFDHPPAVAWAIAPFDALLGPTALGVRAGPVLLGGAAAALLVRYAKDPWLLVLLLGGLPLFTLGGVLATPDAPLVFGWALALAGAAEQRWWLAGVGAGIAALSKYTGWGIWPLLLLSSPRDWRAMLPGVLVTAALAAPNLLWNAQHDWVSVRFQLDHGLGREPPGFVGLVQWLGGQAGLVSPLLFVAFCAWFTVGWRGRDRLDRLAWWTSAPVFVFFAFAATRSTGEANWTAPAWLGASLGLANAAGRFPRAAWVGGGIGAMMSALVLVHLYRPVVDLAGDPTARLGLGRDLASSVQAWGIEPVYTERYQEAALIRFYAGVDAYALPGVARPDQFDLWGAPDAETALFVRPWRSGPTLPTDARCATRGGVNVVSENDAAGFPMARWQVYEVGGCTGIAK